MKAIYLVSIILSIFAASCNKCYECKTGNISETVCKEDYRYKFIKDGVTLTDANGQDLVCTVK